MEWFSRLKMYLRDISRKRPDLVFAIYLALVSIAVLINHGVNK